MKNNIDQIRSLAERYFEAETSPQEELLLSQLLEQEGELPEDLVSVKIMLCGLAQLRSEAQEEAVVIPMESIKRGRSSYKAVMGMVACIASLAAIFVLSLFVDVPKDSASEQLEVYCYIDGEPVTDINVVMEQAKYLEPLNELSESIAALESIVM